MSTVRERGVIQRAEQVRAILAGTRTQMRVRIRKQPERAFAQWAFPKAKGDGYWLYPNAQAELLAECPLGQPGDQLWVRETWRPYAWYPNASTIQLAADKTVSDLNVPDTIQGQHWIDSILQRCSDECIAAGISVDEEGNYQWDGDDENPITWRPSVHMPRWASRITLEITEVRVERVQSISEQYARAEGHGTAFGPGPFSRAFDSYWDELHGAGAWNRNYWVWAITFKVVQS